MVDDRLLLMLGELKATQVHILEVLKDHAAERKALADRVSKIDIKLNRALAVVSVAASVFTVFLPFVWSYFFPGKGS